MTTPSGFAPTLPVAFDTTVAPGGYAWWYLDALSNDGQHGLTIIAFVGSVFSPYYARARRQNPGQAAPMNHCALNVALYAGPGSAAPSGWAMTERGRPVVQRRATSLNIGPSSMRWDNGALTVAIDEMTVPWGKRLHGVVRLYPSAVLNQSYALDAAGLHQWCPIAPCARVEVELMQPELRWTGSAYLDSNRGQRPLEQDFSSWNWSRAALAGQGSAVLYDATRLDGSPLSLALAFEADGKTQSFTPPAIVNLPATAWRLPRSTRSEAASKILQGLEDGPFYARSLVQTQLLGETVTAVHESLCLRRWAQPVVQCMLPFRMPRRSGG